jgi:hypothetical protein
VAPKKDKLKPIMKPAWKKSPEVLYLQADVKRIEAH